MRSGEGLHHGVRGTPRDESQGLILIEPGSWTWVLLVFGYVVGIGGEALVADAGTDELSGGFACGLVGVRDAGFTGVGVPVSGLEEGEEVDDPG